MSDFFLRPRAKADLLQIWNDTADGWGESQADHYLRLINDGFVRLAQYPRLGPACDHIKEGYRKLTVREHLIFYRITEEGIAIIRVLYQGMDVESRLSSFED